MSPPSRVSLAPRDAPGLSVRPAAQVRLGALSTWVLASCAGVLGCAAVLGCAGAPPLVEGVGGVTGAHGGKADGVEIPADWTRGIRSTRLSVDVGQLSAVAEVTLDHADCDAGCVASFEVAGLSVDAVDGPTGPLEYERREGNLHVRVGTADGLTVRYRLAIQDPSQGLGPAGSTSVWPTYCGNLFPCHSRPSDGLTFQLSLSGVPEGATAVFPEAITTETPAYTLAFAVGNYGCEALGTTTAGTDVSVCWLKRVGGGANSPRAKALRGTLPLVGAFEWLETSLGPYAFGTRVASVAADWGDGAAGGMEHHPYWHVAVGQMDDVVTHVHEAAHGWFGAGVRIACWEDLVMSEGTVSYLAARAIGAVSGPEAEALVWADYADELSAALLESGDYVVLPHTCGEVNVLDGLWSNVLYMKGAHFFRDYGELVGHDRLIAALGAFYRARVGTAARTTELLDALGQATGVDAHPLAQQWLLGLGNPLAPTQEPGTPDEPAATPDEPPAER